jgi:hypothetical protein
MSLLSFLLALLPWLAPAPPANAPMQASPPMLNFPVPAGVPFYLMRSGLDRAFHVFTVVNNRQIVLTRVYLRIEGGTFWVPNVRYIEFKGWDATTHAAVVTRITV